MAGNTLTFTDQNFETEVLKSSQPVLVDFWAPWCSPCLRLGPTIEALATEFEGKVRIGKLNTDENQQRAIEYGISSIPALLVFKDGIVVDKIVGAHPKEKIAGVLNTAIA